VLVVHQQELAALILFLVMSQALVAAVDQESQTAELVAVLVVVRVKTLPQIILVVRLLMVKVIGAVPRLTLRIQTVEAAVAQVMLVVMLLTKAMVLQWEWLAATVLPQTYLEH
jgi:hypothetical protein